MIDLPACIKSTTTRFMASGAILALITLGFPSLPSALRWPARIIWAVCLVNLLFGAGRKLLHTKYQTKPVVFSLILALMMLLVVHFSCRAFMRIMGSRDDRLSIRGAITLTDTSRNGIRYCIDGGAAIVLDPVIGWVPRAGNATDLNHIHNSQGLRADKETPLIAPDMNKRILCMGDSFTYGVGVAGDQTYPAQAEKLAPGWEWLNFGIPGTCLTQAYLHYTQNARKFCGKYVIIGFMSNDAQRTVNCFRPFVNANAGSALTKPFAQLKDGELVIQPNPYSSIDDYRRLLANESSELRKLLQLDYLTWGRTPQQVLLDNPIIRTFAYSCKRLRIEHKLTGIFDHCIDFQPAFRAISTVDLYGDGFWSPETIGFKTLCAMFDKFYAEIIKDGRVPLIVLIPGPLDVDDCKNMLPCQYLGLNRHFDSKGYHYIDFLPTLLAKHKDDLSENALFVRGHYQGHVNRELATEIIKALPAAP